MYIPNPRCPPSSSSIVPPLRTCLSYPPSAFRVAPQAGEERTDGRKGRGAGGLLKRASCRNYED
eukprot:6063849-Pyramimonas_sp.AAC.1